MVRKLIYIFITFAAFLILNIAISQERRQIALAQVHYWRAQAAEKRHAYDEAIVHYQAAYDIDKIYRRKEAAMDLNYLGVAYYALSQYPRAIEYYEQALTIRREVHDRAGEGATLTNLGVAYAALSQYPHAIEYYEQALAIHRAVHNRAMEGTILNNLGAAYQALSQYPRAIEYYEQALAIHREVHDRAGEGTILSNLGAAYQALSRYPHAIEYYEQALAIHREVQNRAVEGTVLSNLMHVWQAQTNPRLAIFYGKQAVNVSQTIRSDIQTLDKDTQQSYLSSKENAYRTLADLLITQGRLPEAQQVLNLLKEEEYFDFVRRASSEAPSLQGRADMTPEEAKWEQRYREIADRLTSLGVESRTLRDKPELTPQEDQRLTQLEADLDVAGKAFHQFLDELEQTLGTSTEKTPDSFHIREVEGLMETVGALEAGTVALYTVVTENRYAVILTTADTQIARDYPIPAADLNRKVLAFRQALQNPRLDPLPLAQELYQILLAPIADDLDGANAQTLMWSLDGMLRYLPIAALHDGTHYLIERYRNVVFTPASKTRLKDAPQTTWTGLGLGVSQPHEGFQALPSVEAELNGIIRETDTDEGVLSGTLLLNETFTASALRKALRRPPPVIHIASHFQFRPGNETDSFLLLGDGSHLPLAQLKTWQNVFRGVDLLTLSACDTATGSAGANGKEVEAFGVLAQRKGAKAVVATLWPVSDDSTQVLMQTFYQAHETQAGMSKAEALRQAQLGLLHGTARARNGQTPRGVAQVQPLEGAASRGGLSPFTPDSNAPYAHPYYWAPFILIGNWL